MPALITHDFFGQDVYDHIFRNVGGTRDEAEAFLLDHAFAVPFSISNRSYQMCNLNVFEGQYASFGMANQRYKDQHLYDTSMGLEEYQAAYAEWQSKKAG